MCGRSFLGIGFKRHLQGFVYVGSAYGFKVVYELAGFGNIVVVGIAQVVEQGAGFGRKSDKVKPIAAIKVVNAKQ